MSTEDDKSSTPCMPCYTTNCRVTYHEVLADVCHHYRLPDWSNGRTVVSLGDGLRLYVDGRYVGYIGSLNMEEQKRTSFQKMTI